MSTPAFPVSTLGMPASNYSMAPKDVTMRGKTRDGLAHVSRVSTAGYTEINVEWSWSAAQYAEFQDWYRDDCKDGTISFTIANLYHNNDLATLTARFKDQYRCVYETWEHYRVSATLEVPTHDYISEATLNAALPIDPHTDAPTWPASLFGNPLTEWELDPQPSAVKGSSSGYAMPAIARKSSISITYATLSAEMSNANRIMFEAWWHYKLSDGVKWFWLYCPLHGVWKYAKVRFTEPAQTSYRPVDWWHVSAVIEIVEYNYIPLADCADMIPGGFLPVITVHPASANVVIGVSHTLSVTVTNDETLSGSLRYRWYLDGTPIDGATAASYTFTASSSNDGGYYVIVSNNVGSVTSNTATIATGRIPTILTHPQSADLSIGQTLQLTVAATE